MLGVDTFAPMQSGPTFPSFIAFEDEIIQLGYQFKRDPSSAQTHIITGHIKNKTSSPLS